MSELLLGKSTQATKMLAAWAGALVTLPMLYRTAAAGVLASSAVRLPILLGLVGAASVILWAVSTRRQPTWMALPICAVLGALFTSISVSLTIMCAGMFA